jgi:hypothetical protein
VISRYYGGSDVYMRRRVIAVGLVILAALLIFLIVGGC